MRLRRGFPVVLLLGFALLAPAAARAALEEVLVTSSSETHAIVQRGNGEVWRLELASRCPFGAGLGDQRAFLFTERGVIGPDTRILVPAYGIECRAWKADSLRRVRASSRPVAPEQGLQAVREALELLGYNSGPLDRRGWLPETASAFQSYRESRRLAGGRTQDVRRALTALAIDVMRGGSGTGRRLSQRISDDAYRIADWMQDSGTACGETAWIRLIDDDGRKLELSNRTNWVVTESAGTTTSRWQTGDEVRACSGRVVNARTGEMVAVRRN